MAFFKFRKDSEGPGSPSGTPPSGQDLRRRAQYRLAGASVLVLAAVIGFPLLFDSQPRPIAVDIAIVIPDKEQVKPLAPAAAPIVALPASAASAAVVPSQATASVPRSGASLAQPVPPRQSAGTLVPAPDRSRLAVGATSAAPQPALSAAAPAAKPVASDTARFVVQFGAYGDASKAHEARLRVERAGLKTYAQVTQNADGKRFRVRVGPFAKRADAEQAAEKIRKLDLPTSILEL